MYMSEIICKHMYVYVYLSTYICIYIHICMFLYTYTHTYRNLLQVYVYTHIYRKFCHSNIHMHHPNKFNYTCIYTYIYMPCIYTIHIHAPMWEFPPSNLPLAEISIAQLWMQCLGSK